MFRDATYLRCSRSEIRQLKEVLLKSAGTYFFFGKRMYQDTEISLVRDHKFVSSAYLRTLGRRGSYTDKRIPMRTTLTGTRSRRSLTVRGT